MDLYLAACSVSRFTPLLVMGRGPHPLFIEVGPLFGRGVSRKDMVIGRRSGGGVVLCMLSGVHVLRVARGLVCAVCT